MAAPALLIVSHGSTSTEANAAVARIAEAVRALLGPGVIVEHAFMQFATPTIADGITACVGRGATAVVVHPFMLAPGTHALHDVPRLARDAAADAGVAVTVTPPLGPDPRLAEIVSARYRAAKASPAGD